MSKFLKLLSQNQWIPTGVMCSGNQIVPEHISVQQHGTWENMRKLPPPTNVSKPHCISTTMKSAMEHRTYAYGRVIYSSFHMFRLLFMILAGCCSRKQTWRRLDIGKAKLAGSSSVPLARLDRKSLLLPVHFLKRVSIRRCWNVIFHWNQRGSAYSFQEDIWRWTSLQTGHCLWSPCSHTLSASQVMLYAFRRERCWTTWNKDWLKDIERFWNSDVENAEVWEQRKTGMRRKNLFIVSIMPPLCCRSSVGRPWLNSWWHTRRCGYHRCAKALSTTLEIQQHRPALRLGKVVRARVCVCVRCCTISTYSALQALYPALLVLHIFQLSLPPISSKIQATTLLIPSNSTALNVLALMAHVITTYSI